jgi:hypothetical protein
VFLPNCTGPSLQTGNFVSVTIPPIISNVNVSTTSTTATITFTTSLPVSSQIDYGTNGLFNNSDAASQYQTSHTHVLMNLTSATIYNFYISVDTGQQLVNASPQTFTTQ